MNNKYSYRAITDDLSHSGSRPHSRTRNSSGSSASASRREPVSGSSSSSRPHSRRRNDGGNSATASVREEVGGSASSGSSRSKYAGGFTADGKNTKAYNHDYYIHNKDKWKKPSGGQSFRPHSRQRNDSGASATASRREDTTTSQSAPHSRRRNSSGGSAAATKGETVAARTSNKKVNHKAAARGRRYASKVLN